MKDQRAYLKVKIKSLAEEAKIIRKEERKPHSDMNEFGYSPERMGLWVHRTGPVRREARHALLAYGFIRGRKYRRIEAKCEHPPEWKAVRRMVEKYGIPSQTWSTWWHLKKSDWGKLKEELLDRFDKWTADA
jgi:hypothetical protein